MSRWPSWREDVWDFTKWTLLGAPFAVLFGFSLAHIVQNPAILSPRTNAEPATSVVTVTTEVPVPDSTSETPAAPRSERPSPVPRTTRLQPVPELTEPAAEPTPQRTNTRPAPRPTPTRSSTPQEPTVTTTTPPTTSIEPTEPTEPDDLDIDLTTFRIEEFVDTPLFADIVQELGFEPTVGKHALQRKVV